MAGENEASRRVKVRAIRDIALDTREFELIAADGRPLAPFSAGSHIDVQVPNGLTRQYSLCSNPADASCYRIAVKREHGGRGGSISLHDACELDMPLGIVGPRNHFPLNPEAHRHLFIAGGIGITPIYSMIQTVAAQALPWALHYCARSAAHAAYFEAICALDPARVTPHFSEEPILDVAALLHQPQEGTHIYCCGPQGLMNAVQSATLHWAPEQVHFEWFAAPQTQSAPNEAFEVHLARSGRSFLVPAQQSILDVLRQEGIPVNCACEEGVCGTCETVVLEGHPQHRDALLSAQERVEGRTMMICVSRAQTPRLVLDL